MSVSCDSEQFSGNALITSTVNDVKMVVQLFYCAAILIGCVMVLARPSVCLFLMYRLLSLKQKGVEKPNLV